jgi:hypothetical protein
MTVSWTSHAKLSYYDELDYIDLKWTLKEVEDFVILVNEFIDRLSLGVIEGKIYPNNNIRSVLISKQTTVFFRIYPEQKSIALLLFWNNQRDDRILKKLLQRL